MSKSAKNLIVVLGIITTVFAAYYFFTQEAALVLRTTESDRQLEELLVAAQQFTERQRVLDTIEIDTRIFDSPTFQSLRSFSPKPAEYGVGRPDPFLPIEFDDESQAEPTE